MRSFRPDEGDPRPALARLLQVYTVYPRAPFRLDELLNCSIDAFESFGMILCNGTRIPWVSSAPSDLYPRRASAEGYSFEDWPRVAVNGECSLEEQK